MPTPKEIMRLTAEVSLTALGLYTLSTLAFTSKQKDAIHDRDADKCQFPAKHNCGGRHEIHHIKPQRYMRDMGLDPDYPENGLTLCENAHHLVHPDITQAKHEYPTDKKSFTKAFERREELLKHRQIYWNDEYDRPMEIRAMQLTKQAKRRGWRWPWKGEK